MIKIKPNVKIINLKFGDKSYLSSIIPTMKKKHGIRILFKLSTSL